MRFFNLKSNTLLIYIEMNKTLPIELINLIFSYMSSPTNEIFKNETNYINYCYNKQGLSKKMSFSKYFFNIKKQQQKYNKKYYTYKKYYCHYMSFSEYCTNI